MQLQEVYSKLDTIKKEIHKVIIGQENLIDALLIGMLSNGHILLEGVPGLAKSLSVNTFAKVLGLNFHRIQFTPDLLPGDIIGTLIYLPETGEFKVKFGPLFANIILADEINRSPAKVQSALLEAMQEKQVSIGDKTYKLPAPYLVLATQNPIDQEGTYPLPEAQTDRFLMKIHLDYPTENEELEILERMAKNTIKIQVNTLTNADEIFRMQRFIDTIKTEERLKKYIVRLVHATRNPEKFALKDLKPYIQFGASPRATISLLLSARAYAVLQNRNYVLPEDIKAIAPYVLNHRMLLTYQAEAEGISSYDLVAKLLEKIPI